MADTPTIVPTTNNSGIHGYAGVLNGLGDSAIFRRRTNTAATAKINAAHSTTTKYVVSVSKSLRMRTMTIATKPWISNAAHGVDHRGWIFPRNEKVRNRSKSLPKKCVYL